MTTNVVYLIGSGASSGALRFRGESNGLSMYDVREYIFDLLKEAQESEYKWVRNEIGDSTDIERLITIFEESGTQRYSEGAQELRALFRKGIENRLRLEDEKSDGHFVPELLVYLLDMHNVSNLNEKIKGILTTNYEDLVERAMQEVYGGIDYQFLANYGSSKFKFKTDVPPVLKLHGSFNWKNEYPISIMSTPQNRDEPIWIPPGVVKSKQMYPFNMVWGKAREVLDCDVLRIIGSSLSQNDWDLISLLASTQNYRTDEKGPYAIEFIGSSETMKKIREEHEYVKMKWLSELDEIKYYLSTNEGSGKAEEMNNETAAGILKKMESLGNFNLFSYWLRAKGEYLNIKKGLFLGEASKFNSFIERGLGGG